MGLRPVKPLLITWTLGLAGVETSQALPNNLMDLKVRLRDTTKVAKIAFVSGESGTNFYTLDANHYALELEDVLMTGVTLYAQGTTNNVVLEVLALR